MSARFFWEAVRADGSIARGFSTSPEEAGLHRMPDDLDFLCVIHRPNEPRAKDDDRAGRLEAADGALARGAAACHREIERAEGDALEGDDDPAPERPILSWFERPIRRTDRD